MLENNTKNNNSFCNSKIEKISDNSKINEISQSQETVVSKNGSPNNNVKICVDKEIDRKESLIDIKNNNL